MSGGILLFQFHKGSINTFGVWNFGRYYIYFNSIKVRLILDSIHSLHVDYTEFQFHKGSINTSDECQYCSVSYLFQFHKGSINTVLSPNFLINLSNFNSIKVRLIHRMILRNRRHKRNFNSIKVRLIQIWCKFLPYHFWHFNSIKVRLIPNTAYAAYLHCRYFNSIKVRLILLFFN